MGLRLYNEANCNEPSPKNTYMAGKDRIFYLNNPQADPSVRFFESTFVRILRDTKQAKAPVSQWVGQIRGMAQKGLKLSELDEISFFEALEALPQNQVMTKAELEAEFLRRQPRVKEVTLANPKFKSYHHNLKNEARYFEVLFILNSEATNIEDRIEEIESELEEFNFHPDKFVNEPEVVIRLTKEREMLMSRAPDAYDFKSHHYSETIEGKLGRNLMAHARCMLTSDGTWAIQEIQSDWAQRGRATNWASGFPRAPFVTDTERWSGLVLRRLIQRAALTSKVERVVWLRSWMRNGWMQAREAQEAPPAGQPDTRGDKLDDFYAKSLPKMVNKWISKAGVKCEHFDLDLAKGNSAKLKDCIGFKLTPEVREIMSQTQPLYSMAGVYAKPQPLDAQRVDFLKRHARVMTGARSINFLDKLYDISTGNQVAGRTFNRMIEIAMNAKDPESAINHESFHYVHEHLLTPEERRIVRLDFSEGTELHQRVTSALARRGEVNAALQCERPDECAAHGFALWMKKELSLEEAPSKNIFEAAGRVLRDVTNWVSRVVLNQPVQTPEELFAAVRDGIFAADPKRNVEVLQSVSGAEESGLAPSAPRG